VDRPYGSTTTLPIFETVLLAMQRSWRHQDVSRATHSNIVTGGNKSLLFVASSTSISAGRAVLAFYDADRFATSRELRLDRGNLVPRSPVPVGSVRLRDTSAAGRVDPTNGRIDTT
jgi:hypothetical protein